MAEIAGYCEICGKQFRKYRKFHKCCSDLCRKIKTEKDNYGYVYQKDEEKKCKHCGNTFITNNQKKVYCCDECYKLHQVTYHVKNIAETRICQVCGKSFETTHHAKKYCESECYKIAKKERENI